MCDNTKELWVKCSGKSGKLTLMCCSPFDLVDSVFCKECISFYCELHNILYEYPLRFCSVVTGGFIKND